MKPVKKKEERRGTEQTPGIIFLIPLFSPHPLSQEGFCGSELLILPLHSICTACHFYQIIRGTSYSSAHIILIQYLLLTLPAIPESLATVIGLKFDSYSADYINTM